MILPGMNGMELSRQLPEKRPELKILFVSGYAADIMNRKGEVDSSVNLLSKPFTSQELTKRVRAILDAGTLD
jgi:FixJ family two-component response regulator